VAFEARTTIVPDLIDQGSQIEELARDINGVQRYALQQFSPEGDLLDQSFKNLLPPSREKLIQLARTAAQCGVKEVRIRTRERGEERVSP
jgi:pyruvate-formate lyase-activating enzyme